MRGLGIARLEQCDRASHLAAIGAVEERRTPWWAPGSPVEMKGVADAGDDGLIGCAAFNNVPPDAGSVGLSIDTVQMLKTSSSG